MEKLLYYYEKIDEEIHDAQEYAENAIKYEGCSPEEARVLLSLSSQELDHAQVLQGIVSRCMQEMKRNNAEKYEKAEGLETHLHAMQAKRIAQVKKLHEVFAEHR